MGAQTTLMNGARQQADRPGGASGPLDQAAADTVEFQLLVAELDDVVFRVDAQGRWTFLNPAWERRLGRQAADCLGRPAAAFVHRSDRRRVLRLWCAARDRREDRLRGEVRFIDPQGDSRWMLVAARCRRTPEGALIECIGTLTDVTAAKQAEDDLRAARGAAEAADRAKTEFLSTMSHELRTPLNAIIGLSESLLEADKVTPRERMMRYLEIIRQSGKQLLAQINDILELARIDSGRVVPETARICLASLATEACDAYRREAAAKSLQLDVVAQPQGVPVLADERLLRNAVNNLVSNAIKFTPPGGSVVVRIGEHANAACLDVTDTGPGFPSDKMHLLFKPFSQIDASAARPYGGTGLGLVLVERIVRLHHGRVAATSRPGAGATFSIELPLAAVAQPAKTES